jgi:hypothetical protein
MPCGGRFWKNFLHSQPESMTSMSHDPKRDMRVSLRESDMHELMHRFPQLARAEIADVIKSHGPMRVAVEAELSRISRGKR